MKFDPYLIPYIKINSKCIGGLKVKESTIWLHWENTGEKIYDLGLGNDFLEHKEQEPQKRKKTQLTRLYRNK